MKIMNDPIHKVIKLHPILVKIIDTPEFQRLRYIKQLGCSFFVFPSATHSRFEHSIGVCHLAWKVAKKIQDQLGTARITNKDVLCVSIAGLCHDLGHGAFSHTWEHFMRRAAPEANWKHEHQSIKMFNRIWARLGLENDPDCEFTDNDRRIICDLIIGESAEDNLYFQGKKFLFEIVANKKNGIDVDKWDYFARDSYYLGINISFEFERLLEVAQVFGPENEESIHFRDSEGLNLYHMFYVRWLLNQRAYKHRVSRLIEGMFVDALVKADNDVMQGKKLSELVNDIDDYRKLNDSIFHMMLTLPENHESRKLIERIESRDLYKCVGCVITPKTDILASDIEKFMLDFDKTLNPDHYYTDLIVFDYGQYNEDPIQNVPLYTKYGLPLATLSEFVPSLMLPTNFSETKIWCISRVTDEEIKLKISDAFDHWFTQNAENLNLRKMT